MKLLIVTQIVDKDDPILGFFHRWLEEFAKKFEHIEVICLKEGKHELPANVRVHSIGKEQGGGSALLYGIRFIYLAWKLRKEYTHVFVHMNPEYIMLAGLLWKSWGKKILFWYNHPHAGMRLAIAVRLSDSIFFTSPYAASARFPKAVRMPAGIDTDIFTPHPAVEKFPQSIYFQGRIAPSKNVHVLLEAFKVLFKEGTAKRLTLVGPEDATYGTMLRKKYAALIEVGAVEFLGSRPNAETPALYAAHTVSVNLAAAGHYDKSVLESMASETPVIVSSKAFADLLPHEWILSDDPSQNLQDAIKKLFALTEGEYRTLGKKEREAVLQGHGLETLVSRIAVEAASPVQHSSVFFLINKLKIGGSEKLFLEERQALENAGIPSYIGSVYGTAVPGGVPKERVFMPEFRNLFDIAAYVRLIRFVRSHRITHIHATLEHASVIARISGLFLPRCFVAISEPGMANRKPWYYKLIDSVLNLRTNRIIAGSENVKKSLVHYQQFFRKKIVIVMNGVEVPQMLPLRREDAVFTILAVGSLRVEKGFDVLIRAFAAFKKNTGMDARLVIIGKGPLRESLQLLASELHVAPSIEFLGEQPANVVADWYSRTHCFALSSISEGGPFVLLEAMAAGVPVLATRVGCVPEVVEDGISGVLVSPGRVEELAAGMKKISADSDFRKALGEKGYARVKKVGTFDRHMELLRRALSL